MKIEINVPDGISGDWKVESFTVSKADSDFMRIRSIFQSGRGSLPADGAHCQREVIRSLLEMVLW